ncbi:MAG: nucleotidyltransferase family protein [Gemmatimonadota bacterium]|nr:nucleotidyltransferase family protein [Gemmatimonadota bacterium]
MILAAGLGTRLRPLTETTPKALVEVGGTPMLERIARRLVAAGADRLIVNVHHLAGEVERFLAATDLGVEVAISREPERPLGTGGGVKAAAELFRADEPFFVHNVDILTRVDLPTMYADHRAGRSVDGRLATLAVGRRETSRFLLFDEEGLYGWANEGTGESETVREPTGETERWPFAGIHVIEPALLDRLDEEGAFSIVAVYLRLSAEGHRVVAWDVGEAAWMEVGNPERLERARRAVGRGDLDPDPLISG